MEHGLSKNQILSELTKSTHGELKEYIDAGRVAATQDPEFYAHMIAWNHLKGQIRDSKVALPVITLTTPEFPSDFVENSLAHLGLLDPRNLVRAIRFTEQARVPGKSGRKALQRLVARYLAAREADICWWNRNAVQHRASMLELYALAHVKPSNYANTILFSRNLDKTPAVPPAGSVFEAIRNLKTMSAGEAAGTILNRKIPFLIARGALGARIKEPEIVLALIEQMSPTELVTNTKFLQKLGIKSNAALRGAYEKALARAAESKSNTLKTTRAAEAMDDEALAAKLQALQEKQINSLKGIDGNWLVLADKSSSMSLAIDMAKHVAAALTRFVTGNVYLVFFDSSPRYIDATGKTYDELSRMTKYVTADGATSIGCGLLLAAERRFEIDGIAIVSDAQENTAPRFTDVYAAYVRSTGKVIPVYLYRCPIGTSGYMDRDLASSMQEKQFDLQTFDLTKGKIDYYSLPQIVQTMRANRYSLIDEVMATPLVTLDEVFDGKALPNKKKGTGVLTYA